MEKIKAINTALEYAKLKGIPAERVKGLLYRNVGDAVYLCKDVGVVPNGLDNDLATMPIPILIINSNGGVEETPQAVSFFG